MDKESVLKLIEILEYKYTESNLLNLCESLQYEHVHDIGKLAKEILYKFKKKPNPIFLIEFIKKKNKVISECDICKNRGFISVANIKLAKTNEQENWFSIPGGTVKCPKCYTKSSLLDYLRMAENQKIYKISLIKNNKEIIKYHQCTQNEIDEWVLFYKKEGYTGSYKIIDSVLPKIIERLKYDNRYPLEIWIPEYV